MTTKPFLPVKVTSRCGHVTLLYSGTSGFAQGLSQSLCASCALGERLKDARPDHHALDQGAVPFCEGW